MASRVRDRRRSHFCLDSALRCGVSAIAICVLGVAPAYGQTSTTPQPQPQTDSTAGQTQTPDSSVSATTPQETATDKTDNGTIVVTGIRQSLRNAQNIKRNADTVVDAITAEDIGALPDRSVTEALQRVPGVSINRFAGSNDPDHFSGEGSGVVVRGLTFVRSEFNGRDTFSPGVNGQAINFQDVPADMLGSVQVWKNSTAEMVEGGLSGTVNMNLRLPFDNKGFFGGFSVEAVRTDMRKKWSPVATAVLSNTWDTGAGRFGLLGGISYSKLFTRADGVRVTNFQTRDGRYVLQANETDVFVCRTPLPGNTDTTGRPPNIDAWSGTGQGGLPNPNVTNGSSCFGSPPAGSDGQADWLPTAYAPLGGQFVTQEFDRTRRGYAAAAQWESIDRRALVTAQFLRSHATQKWGEYTFEAAGDLNEYNTFPAGCRPNNLGPIQGEWPNQARTPVAQCFLNGQGQIVGASGTNWQGYPSGQAFPNYTYNDDGVFESGYITLPMGGWRGGVWDRVPQGGMQHTLNRRQVHDTNIVNDLGLNAKFTPNDRWAFNADIQHVRAKHDNLDFGVHGSIFADQELDISGDYPQITPHRPLTLSQTWSAPSAELRDASDTQYFANPRYTFWRSAMDHIEQSRGKEWAFRGDAQYNFNDRESFLRHVKFGARYADRTQNFRYTTYNWGSLSEVWTGAFDAGGAVFMDQTDPSNVQGHDWGNFFRGEVNPPPIANYYSGDLIDDYEDAAAFFESIQEIARSRGGGGATSWDPLAARAGVIPGTPFLPTDIQRIGQKDKAAYGMVTFGSEEPVFGNVRLSGNFGIRYVGTDTRSAGAIGAPTQSQLGVDQPYATRCAVRNPPPEAPNQTPSRPGGICNLGEAGYNALRTFASGEFNDVVNTNDYHYFLPSLNLKLDLARDLILRFAAGRNLARPSTWDLRTRNDYSMTGTVLGATTGNPFLKPAISDNLDASLEWYFGGNRVGSLTLNLFAKNIHNFFFQNVFNDEYTFNGVTEPVIVRRPDNYDKTGKVRGFEVAYQQTYDFLPGALSGLGLSANYAYIKSRGLQNAQLFVGSRAPIGTAGNLPLEQLSKHNVNIQPFYEKGPISLRVAYNWRSKFLLTASDVIFPYYPIFNDATGRIDATFFYKINDHVKVGIQGVNLTNEVTKTLQQFTTSGLLGPRSYFMEDRRFHFILRGNF
jgi:TonB-dependent receptor